jgi:hypothetical protein
LGFAAAAAAAAAVTLRWVKVPVGPRWGRLQATRACQTTQFISNE